MRPDLHQDCYKNRTLVKEVKAISETKNNSCRLHWTPEEKSFTTHILLPQLCTLSTLKGHNSPQKGHHRQEWCKHNPQCFSLKQRHPI